MTLIKHTPDARNQPQRAPVKVHSGGWARCGSQLLLFPVRVFGSSMSGEITESQSGQLVQVPGEISSPHLLKKLYDGYTLK